MSLRQIHIQNLLSFRDNKIELGNLNVLIGPNGAGKSNLIEIIGLLRACSANFGAYLMQGGGACAWIWKGEAAQFGSLAVDVNPGPYPLPLNYSIQFASVENAPLVKSEKLVEQPTGTGPRWLVDRNAERISYANLFNLPEAMHPAAHSPFLSLHRMPADPTPLTRLAKWLNTIRIYREFSTRRKDPLRQGIVGPEDGSNPDELGHNLALVLHEFHINNKLENIERHLQELSDDFRSIKPRFRGATWTVILEENGLLDPVPGQRISDGTLKFLCLLAVLLDPDPPPLVCIEEPETGLHPDALPIVGRILLEASERMQLIVTTHSVELVDSLGSVPESILVCEKDVGHSTQLSRLDPDKLKEWLEHYSLGQLWRKGEIGGNRW